MGTIRQLFDDNREKLDLVWLIGGDDQTPHPILPSEHVSSADLVGHLNLIHPDRIQVFGRPEIAYFEHIDERRRHSVLNEIAAGSPPAIIAADGLQPRDDLVDLCRRENIPLLTTRKEAGEVIDQLRNYLAKIFAPHTTRHGVLMDVLGLGVLITGESGLGKSELALELISRGHGLVADDVVELARVSPNTVEGRCPRLLANLLEVRGLGLLDIKAIFGETAVRRKMRLKLIVHLVRRSAMEDEYERLPLDTLTEDVLGLAIHKVVIPVAAGRNLAVLLEAAVRNTILQLRGIDTMGEFMQRQSLEIRNGQGSGHASKYDNE